jgi:protein-S-isoprenylcysteine O-methyltransferase Ste14
MVTLEAAAREEVESELNRERSLRQEAEAAIAAERERAAAETAEAQNLADSHRRRLVDRSAQVARALSWGAFVGCAILLLVACAAAAQGVFPASWSRAVPLASAFVFVFGLAGLLSLVTGWNLLAARRSLTDSLEPRIGRVLSRLFGPEEPS